MEQRPFLFNKQNYMLVIVGIVFILAGFIAMMGGGSSDPTVYPEESLYGFRRTILAPILILIGYVIQVFAILKKPKGATEPQK